MGNHLTPQALRYHAPVLVCLLAILVLIFLPTGFEGALLYQEAERCKAEVLSVDDSAIIDTGLVRSGEQRCQLGILDGAFAGQTVTGINMLNGSLEQDKIFAPGDVAQVVGEPRRGHRHQRDHDRPLPPGLGGPDGVGLCSVPDFVCRSHRRPGHRLLRPDGAHPCGRCWSPCT